MASQALSYVLGISSSLTGRAWRWRGGNMELGNTPGLGDDIVRQLLLSRGVEFSEDFHLSTHYHVCQSDGIIFHEFTYDE